MKKRFLPLFILMSLFSSLSFANAWIYVEVEMAGKYQDNTMVRAKHSTNGDVMFSSALFTVEKSMENEILAIGMAAIASRKLILVETDYPNAEPGVKPNILAAYLTNRSIP